MILYIPSVTAVNTACKVAIVSFWTHCQQVFGFNLQNFRDKKVNMYPRAKQKVGFLTFEEKK